MNKYLKALREFNGYKLYDDQMEEEVSKLNIAEEVRTMCGLEKQDRAWFHRDEMKVIARRINGKAKFISDKRHVSSYVSSTEIFPKYLSDIWTPQQTKNDHPNLLNMVAIRDAIKNSSGGVESNSPPKRKKLKIKKCSNCNVEKSVGEFHKQSDHPSGLRSHCKTCRTAIQRKQKNNDNKKEINMIQKPETNTNTTTINTQVATSTFAPIIQSVLSRATKVIVSPGGEMTFHIGGE